MGAEVFSVKTSGKTPAEAFRKAVEEAAYEHGHGGYSGTIAEKTSYKLILLPTGIDPQDYADMLIDKCDDRVDDKWGPAGCIDCGPTTPKSTKTRTYLFFGWASS